MSVRTILLVDDVKFFLDQEKTFFNRGEFELLVAGSGIEALEIARQRMPDLIFMDLYMPEMNGDVACYTIKKDPILKEIPVIMVTHGDNEADFERCWHAGCDDIIVKPINEMYFIAATRRFLQITFRKAPRFKVRMKILYKSSNDQDRVLADYSVNLSTGGVFIETDKILPLETELNIEFILPGNDVSIKCKGRVAWINMPEKKLNASLPGGMGLQFINLSWDDMNAIRHFIRKEGLSPTW